MKSRVLLWLFLVTVFTGISGCGGKNNELKNDAEKIAAVMCTSIEAMKNLRTADPADSALIGKLQAEYQVIEAKMAVLYEEFRKKYKEQLTSKDFNDEFRKLLNTAILDCKSLSKEDRENFERELKK